MQNEQLTWLQDPGAVTEVLSGEFYQPLGRSSSHQLWSSAMVLTPAIRGLFGIEADALTGRLRVDPQLLRSGRKLLCGTFLLAILTLTLRCVALVLAWRSKLLRRRRSSYAFRTRKTSLPVPHAMQPRLPLIVFDSCCRRWRWGWSMRTFNLVTEQSERSLSGKSMDRILCK